MLNATRPVLMERYADGTITEPERLRTALDETRRRGYALLCGHFHADAAGVAVPVHNALGEVVAALSVVVPNDGHAKAHIPVLVAGGQGVSRALSRHRPTRVIRASAPLLTNSSGGCGRFSLKVGKTVGRNAKIDVAGNALSHNEEAGSGRPKGAMRTHNTTPQHRSSSFRRPVPGCEGALISEPW